MQRYYVSVGNYYTLLVKIFPVMGDRFFINGLEVDFIFVVM